MDPKKVLKRCPTIKTKDHPDVKTLNPSRRQHSDLFKHFKRLNKAIKHRTLFSEQHPIIPIDTTSLIDEHHNQFGKLLSKIIADQINKNIPNKISVSLITSISKEFHVTFLAAEHRVTAWIRREEDKTVYLVRGYIDAVLWNKETEKYMILDWKSKPNTVIDYWNRKGEASELWSHHLPQAIVYARALQSQLSLDYEPKIMLVPCTRTDAYPRTIVQYGEEDYPRQFTWSQKRLTGSDSLRIPQSSLKAEVDVHKITDETKIMDIFKETMTLRQLCALFSKKTVIFPE